MGFVAELLDKYKRTTGITSDGAIGAAFDVTRQTVSQWRATLAYPDEEKIAALAQGAGDDPGGWLNAIRAERSTGAAAVAYRKIARSFGIAATIAIAVYTSFRPDVCDASPVRILHKPDVLYIAHRSFSMESRCQFQNPPACWVRSSNCCC